MCALESLVEDLRDAYSRPRSEWPSLKRTQLTQTQSNTLSQVLNQLRGKASALGISPSVLCNRKDAENLVLGKRDLRVLKGWRLACVGSELEQLLPGTDG